MPPSYTSGTAEAALELTLRGSDVVNIVAGTLTGTGSSANIVGTGRPDDPSTLEATTMALVDNASVGTEFISLDGAGLDLWRVATAAQRFLGDRGGRRGVLVRDHWQAHHLHPEPGTFTSSPM